MYVRINKRYVFNTKAMSIIYIRDGKLIFRDSSTEYCITPGDENVAKDLFKEILDNMSGDDEDDNALPDEGVIEYDIECTITWETARDKTGSATSTKQTRKR